MVLRTIGTGMIGGKAVGMLLAQAVLNTMIPCDGNGALKDTTFLHRRRHVYLFGTTAAGGYGARRARFS